MDEKQIRRLCKVVPLFEVQCEAETCNGMQDELYTSRYEAVKARADHIRLHLDGQFTGEGKDGSHFP